MQEIKKISGTGIPVRGNDIDTDRIIPARFMKGLTFDDLGQYAFYDARRNDDGSFNDHPFNNPDYAGGSILLVNRNFGCGSSREHAPQALIRSGIKAIIGESFAEIFAGNCTANGIPTVLLAAQAMEELMESVESKSVTVLTLNLKSGVVTAAERGLSFPFSMDEDRKRSLLNGSWDTLGEMLENRAATEACRNAIVSARS